VSVLRQRIEHVNAPETMDSLQDFDAWSERRLDRWIVDWALRHGRTGTAHAIAETKHMEVRVQRPRPPDILNDIADFS
jgi:macrophage erythroblast attacher